MLTRPSVAVIGAGLAGASCARALSAAGCHVTVIERNAHAALGASGNPLGILHPLVSKDHNLASQWVEAGLTTTLRWLDELSSQTFSPPENSGLQITQKIGGRMGQRCGVAQMDSSGLELIHWTSEGAWIRPALFVQACLAEAVHRGARIVLNRTVQDLKSLASEFDHCVLAQADAIQTMVPWAELRLNAIRGTISSFSISEEHSLPHIICASGYATPVIDGEMVVGASFERLSNEAGTTLPDDEAGDSMSNLDRLEIISPKLASICRQQTPRDRTSIRSATLDRMPHVGQLLDPSTPLRPSVSRLEQMPRSARLWVLAGLGSRGLSSAPLGAELLATRITGRHTPGSLVDSVSARVLAAVDPVRFALRRHQRRS